MDDAEEIETHVNIGQLYELLDQPFEYGISDCCQLAGKFVKIKSGVNPMEKFQYMTEEDAAEIIESYGGLLQAVTAELGEPVAVEGGTDFDVLMGKMIDGREVIGFQLMGRMIVKTKKSAVDWPLSRATHRWEICPT